MIINFEAHNKPKELNISRIVSDGAEFVLIRRELILAIWEQLTDLIDSADEPGIVKDVCITILEALSEPSNVNIGGE